MLFAGRLEFQKGIDELIEVIKNLENIDIYVFHVVGNGSLQKKVQTQLIKLKNECSYLMDGDFSGHVYEGYLRETNPTGDKINFTNGAIATYDFSGDLRKFQWGVQAGVDWKAFKHLKVHADLNWGLNDIFNKDFKTVTFDMYAIYLNVGFGYAF